MTIKNKYTRQSFGSLESEWAEVLMLFQQLCMGDHRLVIGGKVVERVKTNSLPPATFLNCVYTIVHQINNFFGGFEVEAIYKSLDKANPHTNPLPVAGAEEYDYCCNTFYERTIIFGAVYYILSVENAELTNVLEAVYRTACYSDAAPYFNHFVYAYRHRKEKGAIPGGEETTIPPQILPDVINANEAYRHLPPRQRKRRFQLILAAIEDMSPEERTSQYTMLYVTFSYALNILVRTYGLYDERENIPETEKLTMAEILRAYMEESPDQKEAILPFIERLLNMKEPSANDPYYRKQLDDDNGMIAGIKAVYATFKQNGYNAADWGAVMKILVEQGLWEEKSYTALAHYINKVCGEGVTSSNSLSRSPIFTKVIGEFPYWEIRASEKTRESQGKLSTYIEIGQIFTNAQKNRSEPI